MKNTEFIPSCETCFCNKTFNKSLSEDEITLLSYKKNCNTHKKGDVIYRESNRTGGVYCLSKGIVKIYKTGIDGKEQIIRFVKNGDIFGFRSILSDEPSSTTAKVIDNAVICCIPTDHFMKLIFQNKNFARKIMKQSCKELGDANRFIIDIAQKSVRERLAEVLLILQETFKTDNTGVIEITLTREELANLVGTATESVIRLLSEFKSDKLISLNGRKIKIIDEQRLQQISNNF